MAAAKFFKMLFLLVVIGAVAALPAFGNGDSSALKCYPGCQPLYMECLGADRDEIFCSELVCGGFGDRCATCDICINSSAAPSDLTSIIDEDAVEASTALVKRIPPPEDLPDPYCIYLCHRGCRRTCYGHAEDLQDALVIEEDAVNGTVSVKIIDQTADSSKPECVQWVCAHGNCWYISCDNGASTEEIASVQTSTATGDSSSDVPPGCRSVCNPDVVDAICITLCDPAVYEPMTPPQEMEPTPPVDIEDAFKAGASKKPEDIIAFCEWTLMGHFLYQVCYAKEPEKTLRGRQADGSRGSLCSTLCWDGSICWVYCGDSSKLDGDSSELSADSSK